MAEKNSSGFEKNVKSGKKTREVFRKTLQL